MSDFSSGQLGLSLEHGFDKVNDCQWLECDGLLFKLLLNDRSYVNDAVD